MSTKLHLENNTDCNCRGMCLSSRWGGCGVCPPQALSHPQYRITYRFSFNFSNSPNEINLGIRGGGRKGKWGVGGYPQIFKIEWKVEKVVNTKSSSLLLTSSAKTAKSSNFQMYLQQPCRHLCIKENETNKTKQRVTKRTYKTMQI